MKESALLSVKYVKIAFGRSGSVEIKTRTVSVTEEPTKVDPVPNNKKKPRKGNQAKMEDDEKAEKKGRSAPSWMEEKKAEQLKRGKKGKMKKIKEKYKDQEHY